MTGPPDEEVVMGMIGWEGPNKKLKNGEHFGCDPCNEERERLRKTCKGDVIPPVICTHTQTPSQSVDGDSDGWRM